MNIFEPRIYPDYWKERPEVLNDDEFEGHTTLQIGAWYRIRAKLRAQRFPGIADFSERKLIKWSRISRKAWAQSRLKILAHFELHPATATIHDEQIKDNYTGYATAKLKQRRSGQQGGLAKNGKKPKKNEESLRDLYPKFNPPFVPIGRFTDEQLDELFKESEISLKNRPSLGSLQGSLKACLSNKVINEVITSAQLTPAPVGGAVEAGGEDGGDGEPVKLGSMLRESMAAAKGGAK